MNQNNNKKPGGGKNNRNMRGVLSLVMWALLLTIIVSYAGNYFTSAGHQASSVSLEYSEFTSLVKSDMVESVDFDNTESILVITPKDG